MRRLRHYSIAALVVPCVFVHISTIAHQRGASKANNQNTGYIMVWTDVFTVDGPPDSTNWLFEQGFVRNN